jgi:hypothetical protein
MGQQFNYMDANAEIFNNADFMMQVGGWKNGEISVSKGIAEYMNPGAYGKQATATGAVIAPLMQLIQTYNLISRRLCRKPQFDPCCYTKTSGCGSCSTSSVVKGTVV